MRQRGCGGRDPGSDPDERPLRVCGRARRHVRAGRLRVVHPRVPPVRLERALGQAARGARDGARLRPARAPWPGAARTPLRRGAPRRHAPVRVGRVPVHAVRVELEHERRDHARVPDLRLLARHVRVRARRVPRPGGVDEVRRAPARASVGLIPGGAPVLRKGLYLQQVLRSRPPLRFRSCSSSRAPLMRLVSSGTAPSAGRSAATRRSRSGAGASTTRPGFPTSAPSSSSRSRFSSQGRSPATSSRGARRRSSSPRSPPRC